MHTFVSTRREQKEGRRKGRKDEQKEERKKG
jgi:hypothetical protein